MRGGFSSAFFLYGIALIYGATKETNLGKIMENLASKQVFHRNDVLLLVGIGLLLVGLAFKVAAVPFQVWTPDVYQGAPTPVTSFMASAGKTAAFAIYFVAFVTGAIVMSFEMLGSRYLNPYFGSGIYTWASLISTVPRPAVFTQPLFCRAT